MLALSYFLLCITCYQPGMVSARSNYQCESTTNPPHSLLRIFVGGYSRQVSLLGFDTETNQFRNLSTTATNATADSPSFFDFGPDGKQLFVSNEVSNFRGINNTGSLTSFIIGHDGRLEKIATGPTGADPVFLAVSPDGKNVITAEYTGGSWSRYVLDSYGGFASQRPDQVMKYNASGPEKARQDHSYIHQVVYNPGGDLVLFVDLGGDKIYVQRVEKPSGQIQNVAHEIRFPPGSGPRHLSMVENSPGEYDIYVITELSNRIFNIRMSDQYGQLNHKINQNLSTLPPDVKNTTSFAAAEVVVTKDKRFVYGTNRQTDFKKPITDNSFVLFGRDTSTGMLIEGKASSPTWFPITIGGSTPRHFSLSNDPHQSFLVAGCQQSNTVLMYARNSKNGKLKLLGSTFFDQPAVQMFTK